MISNWNTLGWSIKSHRESHVEQSMSELCSEGDVLVKIKSDQTLSTNFSYGEIENGLSAMEYRKKHTMGNLRLGKKVKNRKYKTNTWRVREKRCSGRNR